MNVFNEEYLCQGAAERPGFAKTASLIIQFVITHRACFDLPLPSPPLCGEGTLRRTFGKIVGLYHFLSLPQIRGFSSILSSQETITEDVGFDYPQSVWSSALRDE